MREGVSLQVPLTYLKQGERARVLKVRGNADIHRHLENLGFVSGAELEMVCQNAGNTIACVKGARVALDKQVASKIMVCDMPLCSA